MDKRNSNQCCGVPQCRSKYQPGISMHKIPKKVSDNKKEFLKWKFVLKIGKPLTKNFVICSCHFKQEHILIPIKRNKRVKTKLCDSAFPTKNLPKSSVNKNIQISVQKIKARYERFKNRNSYKESLQKDFVINQEHLNFEQVTISESSDLVQHQSVETQVNVVTFDKYIQVTEDLQYNQLPFLIDSDKTLNSMTGVPTRKLLRQMVECCSIIRLLEKRNICFSLEKRIILTMFRLKTNSSNTQTAILFKLSEKTASEYFKDCIQLLAKALTPAIYWQTREENCKNLPSCFEKFPNTITVLDCTEIKTVQFRFLSCRTSTYCHYKGAHTVKLLIGVAPSGLINYISPAVAGRTSDKAVFNLTNLLEKLKQGDTVMVDKGFMIGDELSKAGIEMIRPQIMTIGREKIDTENDRLIAAARVHVERRISRLKTFKILSEKITYSNLPYIDDIRTIICAISNLSLPILNDNKF